MYVQPPAARSPLTCAHPRSPALAFLLTRSRSLTLAFLAILALPLPAARTSGAASVGLAREPGAHSGLRALGSHMRRVRGQLQLLLVSRAKGCAVSALCALLALICGAIGTCESAHAKCHCGLGSARSWLSCAACARAAAAAGLSPSVGPLMRSAHANRHMRNATAVSALCALGSHMRRVRGQLQLLVSRAKGCVVGLLAATNRLQAVCWVQ